MIIIKYNCNIYYSIFILHVFLYKLVLLCTTHLGVKPPGQLRLDHHDDDAKHPADQGEVAEPLPLAEQRPALAQPVADVPVLLRWWRCRRPAGPFLPDQLVAPHLAGLLPAGLRENVLRDWPIQELGGPRLGWIRVRTGRGVEDALVPRGRRSRRVPVGGESRVVDGRIAGRRPGSLEQGDSGPGGTELGLVIVLDDRGEVCHCRGPHTDLKHISTGGIRVGDRVFVLPAER